MCFNSLPLLAARDGDFADFLDVATNSRMVVRLLFASVLGGILGWQREKIGKDAGLRTYMMVSLAAALWLASLCLPALGCGSGATSATR